MSLQPLAGIKVLDFGHTVMGPSCGMILADLGADVIRVEPAPKGDPTRNLKGFGTGYFGFFNRNKRSVAINLKSEQGREAGRKLIAEADVLIENFAPGAMSRLGLDYDLVTAINPRMIYASLKGFLPGPYENRLALDEVVQMMSGLAYMTGPTGRPLRAGSSVIDIAGGMFAVIGILAALREREQTGKGTFVESALYEAAVFLMGQHLCYSSQIDGQVPPMPERVSAWAVYELFEVKGERQIFMGITSDAHWQRFCAAINRDDLLSHPDYQTNNDRISHRSTLIPVLQEIMRVLTLDQAVELCERAHIPFSPIARPEDLFDDEHLAATGGLLPTELPGGVTTKLPNLPVRIGGESANLRSNPPPCGQDTRSVLADLGYSETQIEAMINAGELLAPETK